MKLSTVQFVYQVVIANTAKHFGIPRPALVFRSGKELPNPSITALFLPQANAVVVNVDWVVEASKNEQVTTILHEMRHAFQHHAVKRNVKSELLPPASVLTQWKNEIANPVQPDPNNPTDERYINQSIEQDAVLYAKMNLNSKTLFLP